jgi:hypothetical protein
MIPLLLIISNLFVYIFTFSQKEIEPILSHLNESYSFSRFTPIDFTLRPSQANNKEIVNCVTDSST